MAPRGESDEAEISSNSNLDWPWLSSLNPEQLEESDIEKLLATFESADLDEEEDSGNLKCALRLVSSALKSRDNDLNEAIEHLNNKEVDQEVKNENKRVKKELRELKKENKELDKQLKRFQKAQKDGDGDEALEDLLAVEQSLAQVQNENRQMEKDLERERLLKEDLEKKINLLNVEKGQLARDVESLRDELEQARTGTHLGHKAGNDIDDQEELSKVRELEETIRMKNKQIHSLLEDIEQVEKESVSYQNKVIELRDAMAETTGQMNAMTGEYVAIKESSQHFESLISGLQKENDRLRGLLEEMLEDKRTKEKQIDQVESEVDKRFQQMKDILQTKEATIEELRARLNRAVLEGNDQDQQANLQNAAMLSQALRERDEQVEQLQDRLAQASQ